MQITKFWYVFIWLFFNLTLSFSQSPEPVFRHFTTSDGLPSSQIYQVVQDKNGYLWFASDRGLVKYNGYKFKTFTAADGLLDNTVFKLLIDKKNRLWLQTFSGQLFYIENDKVISYKFNKLILDIVKNNLPKVFYVDSLENVSVTCLTIGEFKIDRNGKVTRPYYSLLNNEFNQVFIDEIDNKNYITSGYTNFNKLKSTHFYFKNTEIVNDTLSKFLKDYGQISLTRIKDGRLLISMENHLYDFNNGNLIFLEKFPDAITNIFERKDNKLWVTTYLGVHLFDPKSKLENRISYFKREFITSSIEDNEGGIWITTLNRGVYYLLSNQIKNYLFEDKNLTEPICLSADRKNIYAGIRNGNILKLNKNSFDTVWTFPENSFISHIFTDTITNKIYFSKAEPGYLINNIYYKFKIFGSIRFKGNYLKRKNGNLLNPTVNGIYKIENDSIITTYYLSQRANCIYENKNTDLLIGCNNGIFKLDEESGKTILYHIAFKNIRVDDIGEIDSVLFLATRGSGLGIINKNKVIFINELNGLCSNILHHINISGKIIWCSSYNGLSKVIINSLNPFKYEIKNIGIHDGLPNNEINDLIVYNDTVWVASKTAISYFNQNDNFSNKIAPLLNFSHFIVNSKDTIICNNTKLPFASNNIEIGFEAISFKSGSSILYKYSLINESDTFSSKTNDLHVEFISLKPGKYEFQVTAMNSSGFWGNSTKKLNFEILKPFWQEWWFIALTLLFVIGIIFKIVSYRIARIKNEEALKTDFNKQIMLLEIKALRAQMNPHFIFNVINSIQDYILKNDSKSAHRYLTKFAKLIRLILDNSFEGEVLLSQEIQANELYIELEQQRFEGKFDFVLDVNDDLDIESILIPSMIIQPFLENAIKHGLQHLDTKGKLILVISKIENNLLIIIEDNGIGRDAANKLNKDHKNEHISRGSFITTKRVEAYNKAHNTMIELKIIDFKDANLNNGTRIELKIPIKYRSMKAI